MPEGADPGRARPRVRRVRDAGRDGQKARAADALVAIVDDPARAAWHGESYALLGNLLARLDLSYASLVAYAKAFELAGPEDTRVIGARVPEAIALAEKVGDLGVLEKPFAKNLGLAQNEDVRGKMAFMAAREAVRNRRLRARPRGSEDGQGGRPALPGRQACSRA